MEEEEIKKIVGKYGKGSKSIEKAAKELGISIKEYYSNPDNVIKAQLKMQQKYSNDCIYAFYYAAIEVEAFGGEVIFREESPPNAGEPIIKSTDDIDKLNMIDIKQTKPLMNILKTISEIKKEVTDTIPIIGVVVSPFSLPVMQMGFEKYLDLIYENPEKLNKLMEFNKEFSISWANEQLDAGATAICYFDPVSSPSILPQSKYLETGYKIACEVIQKIKGPTATHFGAGLGMSIIDDVKKTGTYIISASSKEDLLQVKNAANNKIAILGNLNGIEMCSWNDSEVEKNIKSVIKAAAKDGGFILSDNHGEIPYQVKEETLLAISESVKKWGTYPLDWIDK
jgi:uroporphyrinogen decarboxylase